MRDFADYEATIRDLRQKLADADYAAAEWKRLYEQAAAGGPREVVCVSSESAPPPQFLGLTLRESELFLLIARAGPVGASRAWLEEAMYGELAPRWSMEVRGVQRHDRTETNVISVFVHKIRKTLRRTAPDIQIETMARGYRLSDPKRLLPGILEQHGVTL